MSGNLAGFNARDVAPNGFDVLPAGEYEVCIVASEVKPTAKGDGSYLKLQLQVLNGQHQNRTLFDILNLWNPNSQAVEIARGTLSSICRAVGVLEPKDSCELHNKPLRVKVKVTKSEEYGEQNKVAAYKPRNAGPATTPQAAPAIAEAPWPQTTVTETPAYQQLQSDAEKVF
jgi:hypothetical protein